MPGGDDGEKKEETAESREEAKEQVFIIMVIIMVLMLVNILIAMFSDTYSRIKEREDVIFKFQRVELLMEMEESYVIGYGLSDLQQAR